MSLITQSSHDLRGSRRSKVTTEEIPAIVKPLVDPEVVTSIDPSTLEDSHVYVHCHFQSQSEQMLVRVWRTTFLIDKASGTQSQLLHVENVSMAPQWTAIPANTAYTFLLIFSSLPKDCVTFDFIEDIPQMGGFHVPDIPRNSTDVYHVDLH